MKIKSVVRYLTPPIIWDAAHSLLVRLFRMHQDAPIQKQALGLNGGEKDATWYNENFPMYMRQHYTETKYYCLWTVIVDRIQRSGIRSVLEVGCGAGQFAALLRDKGLRDYCGFDFSSQRIQYARSVCPEFRFSVEDAFETDLYTTFEYDAMICNEFLEHVERDVETLRRIRSGARFYGTVPNFPSASHVRYFNSGYEVADRYRALFVDLQVEPFLLGSHTFFLLEGRRA